MYFSFQPFTEGKSEQEPGAQTMGEPLLACFQAHILLPFLYGPGPPCLEMVLTTGLALLHQLAIRRVSHNTPIVQFDGSDSSIAFSEMYHVDN